MAELPRPAAPEPRGRTLRGEMLESLERSHTVTTPAGETWQVRRVILPRLPKLRDRTRSRSRDRSAGPSVDPEWWQVADVGLEGLGLFGEAPAVALAVAAVVLLFILLAPVLVLLLDLIVVLVVTGAAVLGRLFFRRPWRVEATNTSDPLQRHAWGVVGTRASAAAVDAIRRDLSRGIAPTDLRPGVPLSGSGPGGHR